MLPALVWHVFCVCFASKVIVFNMFNLLMEVIYERSKGERNEERKDFFILLIVLGMLSSLHTTFIFLHIFLD